MSGNQSIASDIDKLLRLQEVQEYTSLSETTIYRKMAAKTFPAALRLSGNIVRWRTSEIKAWLNALPIIDYTPPPPKKSKSTSSARASR